MNVNNSRGAVEAARHVCLQKVVFAVLDKADHHRRRFKKGEITRWQLRGLLANLKQTYREAERNILEA